MGGYSWSSKSFILSPYCINSTFCIQLDQDSMNYKQIITFFNFYKTLGSPIEQGTVEISYKYTSAVISKHFLVPLRNKKEEYKTDI